MKCKWHVAGPRLGIIHTAQHKHKALGWLETRHEGMTLKTNKLREGFYVVRLPEKSQVYWVLNEFEAKREGLAEVTG